MTTEAVYRPPSAATLSVEAARLDRQVALLWESESAALREAGLTQASRVLDLGCGPGIVLARIKTLAPPTSLLVGIDLSEAFTRATTVVAEAARANALDLPFADNTFDLVYARFVLRHIKDSGRILREIHRILRPEGSACVLDADDEALMLEPEPPGWIRLRAAQAATARRRGGNPCLGRQVRSDFHQAGFSDVCSQVLPRSTDDLTAPGFKDVLLVPRARPVDPDLMGVDEVHAAIAAIEAWSARPDAFGYGICIVTRGRKRA